MVSVFFKIGRWGDDDDDDQLMMMRLFVIIRRARTSDEAASIGSDAQSRPQLRTVQEDAALSAVQGECSRHVQIPL
jgi:hypothetical protein